MTLSTSKYKKKSKEELSDAEFYRDVEGVGDTDNNNPLRDITGAQDDG